MAARRRFYGDPRRLDRARRGYWRRHARPPSGQGDYRARGGARRARPPAAAAPRRFAAGDRGRRGVSHDRRSVMAGPELVFAPLGGIGEIGMNLSIYGFGDGPRRKWLIVDCGVSFGSEEYLPGVDLILPDIRFLLGVCRDIVGLVLTHAHEDHMGALIDLWPKLNVPLYATPFAAALFEARRLSEPGAPQIPVTVVPLNGRIELAPFTVDFVNVAHSIPESNALAIRTTLGTVVHTGDWKIDPTPLIGSPTDAAKLSALGDEGVLALVGDSTNAVREGRSPSEA